MASDAVPVFTTPSPRIRVVPVDRPWLWLARGWSDLTRAPAVALAYGASLVVVSFLLTLGLALAELYYLILPLAAGFMLLAPLLAVGLYEVSRRLERGAVPPTLLEAALAWRRNPLQIALSGLVLMLIHLAWVRLATLLFALFFEQAQPTLAGVLQVVFLSRLSLPFLATGALIGAALAAAVFAISAVSFPMLLDRDVGVATAIATSLTAVAVNWRPMALWAGLIVVFTSLGLATFYVGLALALPLVAMATWHCYRDVVDLAAG
jgi:uncharacterized membrane protein